MAQLSYCTCTSQHVLLFYLVFWYFTSCTWTQQHCISASHLMSINLNWRPCTMIADFCCYHMPSPWTDPPSEAILKLVWTSFILTSIQLLFNNLVSRFNNCIATLKLCYQVTKLLLLWYYCGSATSYGHMYLLAHHSLSMCMYKTSNTSSFHTVWWFRSGNKPKRKFYLSQLFISV